MSFPPLILTLTFDQATFERLNALRSHYFPRERQVVSAHVTLFHALPGEQESAIRQTLQATCATTSVMDLTLPGPRFLGRGVAVEVESPELLQLRAHLASTWHAWLGPQDQQKYRPHVTIQNKVASAVARQLYDQLVDTWQPFTAQGQGLALWRYMGGPWERADAFSFEKT